MKLFSFGVVADVQYAHADDGTDYHQTKTRYYRSSKDQLKEVVDTWNEKQVHFAVQLGDLIDGLCKKKNETEESLQEIFAVLNTFKSTGLPVKKCHQGFQIVDTKDTSPYVCHIWGNHEFYNLTRSQLWTSLLNSRIFTSYEEFTPNDIDNTLGYYYSFMYKGFRMIALDVYEVSIISRPPSSKINQIARDLLKSKNENEDVAQSGKKWPNFVSWNGGVTKQQLEWLRNELKSAKSANEKVMIFSHCPLHPQVTKPASTCWNFEEILIKLSESRECVVACFSGHNHDGGYYYDNTTDIHYITLEGVVERAPHENSYAIVDVFADRLELNGYGITKSRVIRL